MKWPRKRLAVVMLVLAVLGVQAVAETNYDSLFAGGTGQPNDPYQIATTQQLCSIGSDPNLLDKHYVLINNIDLDPCLPGGQVFTKAVIAPIWWRAGIQGTLFSGSFNGQGYKIRELTIIASDPNDKYSDYLGLFGGIASQAIVTRLNVTDANICAEEYSGVIAGWSSGELNHCSSSGSIKGGWGIGGLVGGNNGDVDHCSSTCTVIGERGSIGGLVGYNNGDLFYCVRENGVTLGGYNIGGLVGNNDGSLSHCHSSGMVRGRLSVGGLTGEGGFLSNCTSSGVVMTEGNEGYVGGLVGYGGSVHRCQTSAIVIGKGDVDYVGGAFGILRGDAIQCSSSGLVVSMGTGRDAACGGFAGINDGYIGSCYSLSDVMGVNRVGGFVGENDWEGVSNCYSRGSVMGQSKVGGFIAENGSYISNCYSSGPVDGNDTVGGFIASGDWGNVLNFWDIEVSGQTDSKGGTGLPTTDMQDINTYLDAGWDFVDETVNGPNDIWMMTMDPMDYPRLSWE